VPTIIQNQHSLYKINQISFLIFLNGCRSPTSNKHNYHVLSPIKDQTTDTQQSTKFSVFCEARRLSLSLFFSTWPFPPAMLRLLPKPLSLPSPPSESHQNPRISIWVGPNPSAHPYLAMLPVKVLPYVTSMGEKTILQLCRGRTPSVGSDNLAESTYLKPFYPLLPSLRKLSIPSQTMKISRFVIIKF
jgi:hypothetical protein